MRAKVAKREDKVGAVPSVPRESPTSRFASFVRLRASVILRPHLNAAPSSLARRTAIQPATYDST
jgi:hypothetical protein